MNPPRKHHYIPVFYLKQWLGPTKQLCEYKLIRGKVVTRSAYPDSTGFEIDLYKLEGAPPEVAQRFESVFMRPVDDLASGALRRIVTDGPETLNAELRSAWARFLLSLLFRNPEAVSAIKQQMLAVANAAVESLRPLYEERRSDTDPQTFDEFVSVREPSAGYETALRLLQEVIDNDFLGPVIFDMHWSRIDLPDSPIELLTSDRPLDMPIALESKDTYIALPLGPKTLFVAGRGDVWRRRILSKPQQEVATLVNQRTVSSARRFVWGTDDQQLGVVTELIGKGPDRRLFTDEQSRRAIEAARGEAPTPV